MMRFDHIKKTMRHPAMLSWMALAFLATAAATASDHRGYSAATVSVRSAGAELRSGGPDLRSASAGGIVVVKRRSGGLSKASAAQWKALLARAGAVSVEPRHPGHRRSGQALALIQNVRLGPGADVTRAVRLLQQDPSVEWAEAQAVRALHLDPNDPMLQDQWALTAIRAADAWDVTRESRTVVIAIVDNGTWIAHPELSAAIVALPGEIPGNGIDDDANGFIDDAHGWDFGNDDPNTDPSPSVSDDIKYHGTAVATVAAAATDNGVGIASPGWNPSILPVKCAPDEVPGSILYGDKGIVYAADNGADLINCSFGSTTFSNAEAEAVAYAVSKGVLIVASAGNDNGEAASYPAGYPGVLSVASTDQADQLSSFSNYGTSVDLCAPGEAILAAWGRTDYSYLDGTSFSSPLAAGTAALVMGQHPEWTGLQAGEQIRVSALPIDQLNPETAGKLGSGRLDAQAAVGTTLTSVRVDSFTLAEGPGADGDGIFDPGETVLLTIHVKNYLEPVSGVTIRLVSETEDVSVLDPLVALPGLATLESWSNSANPARLSIAPGARRGQHAVVMAELDGTDGATREPVGFDIALSFVTIRSGHAGLTVASNGRLGSADTQFNQGVGFEFDEGGDRGVQNLLFEGAFMAAVSSDSVSDVARGADPSAPQNGDFTPSGGVEARISRPGTLADEQAFAAFSDSAASPALGLRVTLTALAFQDDPNADYVLLAYRLKNESTRILAGVHAGLFMDWDVEGDQDAWHDLAGFDTTLALGYIGEPESGIQGGLALLTKNAPAQFKLIDNESEIYPEAGGFTDAKKWAALSGGVQPADAGESPADYSLVLGAGPFTIAAGDSALLGYAVLGGKGLDGLEAGAVAAAAAWRRIFESGNTEPPPGDTPESFDLEPAYPNPFNSGTVLRYGIAEPGRVSIEVTDILGRHVATLVDENAVPGRYKAVWDGSTAYGSAPAGVYLVRMRAGGFAATRKIALVR
jgi:serine protease